MTQSPKVVRVVVTLDNGTTMSLEGEAAKKWDQQVKDCSQIAWNHGFTFEALPWVVTSPLPGGDTT